MRISVSGGYIGICDNLLVPLTADCQMNITSPTLVRLS